MKTVYIVIGRTGEYSDSQEWPVCWRESLDDAQAFADKLTAEAVAFKEWEDGRDSYDGNARNERMKAMTDPHFSCDYTGTTYGVWSVSKEPRP